MKLRALGVFLLIITPIPVAITHITVHFVEQVTIDWTSDVMLTIINVALSAACFGMDYYRRQKLEK